MSILTALYAVSEKLGVSARTNNVTEQIRMIRERKD